MIAEIIKLLHSGEWYGAGEFTEIAKGKNAIPRNWKEANKQIKRYRLWQFGKK